MFRYTKFRKRHFLFISAIVIILLLPGCSNQMIYPGFQDTTNQQFREYFSNEDNTLDPIEGYWSINKNLNPPDSYIDELDVMRMVIVKDTITDNIEQTYVGVVLQGKGWRPGAIGAEFSPLGYSNAYLCTQYESDGRKEQCMIKLDENMMLTASLSQYTINYVRIYPIYQDSLVLYYPDSTGYAGMSGSMPMVAILPFETSQLTRMESNNVVDILSDDLRKRNKFDMYNRSNLEQVFKEHQLQLSGCTSNECIQKAGEVLGVPYIITGSVSKRNQMVTVIATLLNVQSTKEISSSRQTYTSFDSILSGGLSAVADDLVGAVVINKPMVKGPFVKGSSFTMKIEKCFVSKSRDQFDENDLFAEILVDGKILGRSNKVDNNNAPILNYSIDINDYGHGPILVRLIDEDGFLGKDFVGSIILPQPINGTYPVMGFSDESEIGTIEVSFELK